MFNMDVIKEYVELKKEYDALNDKSKEVKERLDSLAGQILETMIENDVDKISAFGKTLYPKAQIWAEIKDKEKAISVLKSLDMEDLITINYQRLSSYVREAVNEGRELPPEFKDVITPEERKTIGVRSS